MVSISFLFALPFSLNAQNLISDGGFENITSQQCSPPKDGFKASIEWYAVQGTPDLFNNACPLPDMGEIFWTEGATAFEGSNFAGLRTRVNTNQTFNSEGIAIRLDEPLAEGTPYTVRLKVRNKGFYQGFPSELIECPLRPEKKIEIYTHDDSLLVINNFSEGTAMSNGELVGNLTSEIMESETISEFWSEVGTCFVPSKNSSYFSLIMPLGNFGTFPSCAADDTKGTFYSYYYDIDDIELIPLDQFRSDTIYLEQNSSIEPYLPELFDLEVFKDVSYIWSDGFQGARRSLEQGGTYTIQAQLNCATIEISLFVAEVEVEIPFYIPNSFSPNDDGVNDFFQIFIPSEIEVIEYTLEIFDRWGNKIFRGREVSDHWDGSILGNRQILNSTFLYRLECRLTEPTGERAYKTTGSITILE